MLKPVLASLLISLASSNIHHAESRASSPAADSLENFSLTGRIVNGTKAHLKQFPHQVSLRRSHNLKHFCGGVIISTHHVLTAAHCMFLQDGVTSIKPWTIAVVAGEMQLNRPTPSGQRRGVDKISLHPEFDYPTLQNDIAVLTLKVPFTMTPEVQNAPLSTHSPITGKVCQISGWGYPAVDVPITSNDLMYVDLPILSPKVCRKLLANVTDFPPGMYCAGYIEGGKDACQGDSGGGMVCDGVLTGVVSGGEGCAYPRLPGVYSDVFYYGPWIRSFNGNFLYQNKSTNTTWNTSSTNKILNTVMLFSLLLCIRLF